MYVTEIDVGDSDERVRGASRIDWVEEAASFRRLVWLLLLLGTNPYGLPERPHCSDIAVCDVANDALALSTRVRLDIDTLREKNLSYCLLFVKLAYLEWILRVAVLEYYALDALDRRAWCDGANGKADAKLNVQSPHNDVC